MAAAAPSVVTHLSMANACFISIPSHPFLRLSSSNPGLLTLLLKSQSSLHRPFLSLRRNHLPPPLVAQTSDWAQQDEEEGAALPELSEWEGEGEESLVSGDSESEVEDEFVERRSYSEPSEEEEGAALPELSEWEGEESLVSGDSESEVEDGFVERRSYSEPSEEAKLFVGNLTFDTDSEKLAQLFDKAGVVEVAEVIYSRETYQSRGFGFVTMSTVEEAEKAVEMFHHYEFNGRLLTVNKAAPRGSRLERPPRDFGPSFKIYVGNLPWQVDDARLEQVFSEHGKVVDARVVCDRETGRSRGFGFVTMAMQTEMNDAIAALDGEDLDGRAIRVNAAEERARRSFF